MSDTAWAVAVTVLACVLLLVVLCLVAVVHYFRGRLRERDVVGADRAISDSSSPPPPPAASVPAVNGEMTGQEHSQGNTVTIAIRPENPLENVALSPLPLPVVEGIPVPPASEKPPAPQPAAKGSARYENAWHPCTVTRVHPRESTIDVIWRDGSYTEGIPFDWFSPETVAVERR